MEIDVLFAAVPVTDLATATSWYGQLLGRPPDVLINENKNMWQIAGSAWLYLVVDPARAGQTVVSMALAQLDDAIEGIEGRGISVASFETIPGAGRKAYFEDTDGNRIAIIEVLEPEA